MRHKGPNQLTPTSNETAQIGRCIGGSRGGVVRVDGGSASPGDQRGAAKPPSGPVSYVTLPGSPTFAAITVALALIVLALLGLFERKEQTEKAD